MYKREKEKRETKCEGIAKIPIYNIPMMSDEEWNRLAYKNALMKWGVY